MEGRYRKSHKKPRGPGDSRPTALQIIRDEQRNDGSLKDKVILITGCSDLGTETAHALKAALGDILDNGNDDAGKIELLKLDLGSLTSVRDCAAEFLSSTQNKSKGVNILIANAGVRLVPKGKIQDGFEVHCGTNHLSHFLLFQPLKPGLPRASTPDFASWVVVISSTVHRTAPLVFDDLNFERRKYNGVLACGQSKLANVYMAIGIERRYCDQGLHAWSVHPGGICTGLQRPNFHYAFVYLRNVPLSMFKYMQNTEQGSVMTVWAAVSRDLEGEGGKYLEKCQVSEGIRVGADSVAPGHAPFVYNEQDAKRLYDLLLQMVGVE
ncbi:NAD(P)-binding protein [Xylariaceae sp. FL0255]|nr:NAD(P)-binding protein [Xylariaceae sp. FL0255]